MAAKIITLLARKGGVGRTTLTINLAGALAKQGRRVLVVDMEGQASLSQFFLGPEMVEQLSKSCTVTALFDDHFDPDPQAMIRPTHCENIWLAPSSEALAIHELPQPHLTGPLQFALRDLLIEVAEQYDYILIDTPPNIYGLLAWNALMASRFAVMPVHPEAFSAQALIGVQRQIEKAMKQGNPNLELLGYIINLREKKPVLQNLTEERIRRLHRQQVFETVVPKSQIYSDAIPYQQPITQYKPRSQAAKIIDKLANELQDRISHISSKFKQGEAA